MRDKGKCKAESSTNGFPPQSTGAGRPGMWPRSAITKEHGSTSRVAGTSSTHKSSVPLQPLILEQRYALSTALANNTRDAAILTQPEGNIHSRKAGKRSLVKWLRRLASESQAEAARAAEKPSIFDLVHLMATAVHRYLRVLNKELEQPSLQQANILLGSADTLYKAAQVLLSTVMLKLQDNQNMLIHTQEASAWNQVKNGQDGAKMSYSLLTLEYAYLGWQYTNNGDVPVTQPEEIKRYHLEMTNALKTLAHYLFRQEKPSDTDQPGDGDTTACSGLEVLAEAVAEIAAPAQPSIAGSSSGR